MNEESEQLNSYTLSRTWFDFCFENPELIKPIHSAIYFFAIEHCNRLGWKKKFGFPSTMTMDALGVKSYNTYIKALNDVVDFGFITMVQKSKNQYSANIIALSKYNKALDKALDKAFIKHTSKQSESTMQSTIQSIDSINKQVNKEPIEQTNNEQSELPPQKFNPKKYVNEIDWIDNDLWIEWIDHKRKVKASVTERSLKANVKKLEGFGKDTATFNIEKALEKNWKDFYIEGNDLFGGQNKHEQVGQVLRPQGEVQIAKREGF